MSTIKKTATDQQQQIAAQLAMQDPFQILPKTAQGTGNVAILTALAGDAGTSGQTLPTPATLQQTGYSQEMSIETKGDTYNSKSGVSGQDNAKFVAALTDSAIGYEADPAHKGSDIADFAKQEVAKLAKAGVTMDASTIETAVKQGISQSATAASKTTQVGGAIDDPNSALTNAMSTISSIMSGFNSGATNKAMKPDLQALYKAAKSGDLDAYNKAAVKVSNDFDNVGKMKGGVSGDTDKFRTVLIAVDQGADAIKNGGKSTF